jgi:tRNA(Ile2) C34 agmatinyltransferase TiaS
MITIIVTLVLIYLVIRLLTRDPKCPICGYRVWIKSNLWYQWECKECGCLFDPLEIKSHRML